MLFYNVAFGVDNPPPHPNLPPSPGTVTLRKVVSPSNAKREFTLHSPPPSLHFIPFSASSSLRPQSNQSLMGFVSSLRRRPHNFHQRRPPLLIYRSDFFYYYLFYLSFFRGWRRWGWSGVQLQLGVQWTVRGCTVLSCSLYTWWIAVQVVS